MALSLPADLYRPRDVATVSGLCGSGAGFGTIGSTFLIGVVADRFSFGPILVAASVVPLVAALLAVVLIHPPAGTSGTWSTRSDTAGRAGGGGDSLSIAGVWSSAADARSRNNVVTGCRCSAEAGVSGETGPSTDSCTARAFRASGHDAEDLARLEDSAGSTC